MKTRSFYPTAPFNLIQSVRAAHALMATTYDILVRPEHSVKFEALAERFGDSYTATAEPAPELPLLIDHREPRTAIGGVERPLILSSRVPDFCRSLWCSEREIRFSFAGLITESRKRIISDWLQRSSSEAELQRMHRWAVPFQRLWKVSYRILGDSFVPGSIEHKYGDTVISSSLRGRSFPVKSWDDDYFRLLGRSRFVLCPDGDYVWTYRFFEAALCGAIPVVQHDCPAYRGFRFRFMSEDPESMMWCSDDAEHNFQLATERLTVPTTDLEREVDQALKAA